MKKMKRFVSIFMAMAMVIVMNGASASAVGAAAASGSSYYSKGLVVLNIATAGASNKCTITSGSVPENATITKVELRGIKSTGSGTVYWYVQHAATGLVKSAKFESPATITSFNGLLAKSSWTVWIEGDAWSTVKSGSIKVYYTY